MCLLIFSTTACQRELTCNLDKAGILDAPVKSSSSKGELFVREIGFFIDATESMKGFATAAKRSPQASSYHDLMRSLENSIQGLSTNSTIHKYKFGENIIKLDDNSRLNDIAINEEFYISQEIGQETQIQNLFEGETSSSQEKYILEGGNVLSVIVTELFQQGTDFGLLSDALAPYIMRGASVGLLGVSSEFSGKIFDYSGDPNANFDYPGVRPVYALIVGEAENILHYFNLLKINSQNLRQNSKFTIFSNQIFRKETNFFQTNPFNVENLVSLGFRINDYFSFRWKDSTKSASFTTCSENPKPFSEDVAGYQKVTEFEKDVTVKKIGDEAKSNHVDNSSITVNELDIGKESKCSKPNASKAQNLLGLRTTIEKNDWQGNYLIDTAFKPNLNNYPSKWDEWSTDNVKDNPSKTLNLTELIKLIYSVIVREYKPEIRMTFCINK